jgi:hypothetical protein
MTPFFSLDAIAPSQRVVTFGVGPRAWHRAVDDQPADAIKRLLAERPQAKGLAVGGMPTGSPGMEVPGTPPDTYDVILFSSDSQRVFARYRGAQVI